MGLIWEISLAEFVFVTLILGGGAAWLAGRALALAWEPMWKTALWMVPLAAAVRFIHYALFSGSLLTLHFYLVDLAILVVVALAGHRVTLATRMVRQYGWMLERAGSLGWRGKRNGA